MANTLDAALFSAPVAGQSLTDEPGNSNWEKPPKYASASDACEYVWDQLNKKDALVDMYNLFSNTHMSIQDMVQTIIFGGFSGGLWTPDVAMLMAYPVFLQVSCLARMMGLNPKITNRKRDNKQSLLPAVDKYVISQLGKPASSVPDKVMQSGLMSPGEGMED